MSWQKRVSGINVGDRVCFKASFLRNTGQITGETPHLRGEVKDILTPDKPTARAVVLWDGWEEPQRVLVSALSKVTQRGILDE